MFELLSSVHPQWAVPVLRKHPLSPEGTADLPDCSLTVLVLFQDHAGGMRGVGKIKCTACLLLCPAELERQAAQGNRAAGVKTKKGEAAVLCRGCTGLSLWVLSLNSFVAVWCNYWWCHQVCCIIYALPFFLTFSCAVHRELYNSQKGVALISKGDCLYPNDEKLEEFIRRLK